ncbi:hypothetical protein H6P81_012036 [Aristolochia fimbriata]|uniref:RRM domain-containing protein n=1 Tax=Aristolochia fimbriata TaxID=158543 RepID=A0AAV7EF96_ARIFI|nr:hypothetical protein H6P81_012036 [Aristolochia fimbriata]
MKALLTVMKLTESAQRKDYSLVSSSTRSLALRPLVCLLMMDRAVRLLEVLGNKDRLTYIFLIGCCGALSIRSVSQQKDVNTLQLEKEDLEKTNKAMKKAMWDWKQQLFSEATDSSSVPLTRLKAIYGENPAAPLQQVAEASATSGSSSPAPKFVKCNFSSPIWTNSLALSSINGRSISVKLLNCLKCFSVETVSMASLFKDPMKLSAYRDRRFPGSQEEFEHALQTSTTVYIGNMSFYTTEEQLYELFFRAGEIKKIIMGLDKNTKTPCGFCFVIYYSRDDAEDAVKYISGTILDDRPIRVDFDWGFQEGRQWGRGRSGGQVRDEYRTDYDPDILVEMDVKNLSLILIFVTGGYGKLVQRELEAQRHLVDYGAGSLGFQSVVPHHYGRQGGGLGHDRSHRHGRDYQRKRHREDDRSAPEMSRRNSDQESKRTSDQETRPEKNPRFRESGDTDDEDDDDRKRPH